MAYVVAATWKVLPGEEKAVANTMSRLAALSREEPGNLMYQVHRDPDDPSVLFMYEQYVDETAFGSHISADYFQRLCLEDAVPRLAERSRVFYQTWDGAPSDS